MSGSMCSRPYQESRNIRSKSPGAAALPSTSPEYAQASPPPDSKAADTIPDSPSLLRGKFNVPELLKAVAAFRSRNGISPTWRKCMPDFFNEVKDFVPIGLSENQLLCKLLNLRKKFREIRSPDCAGLDRNFYELGLKAWGPRVVYKTKGNAKNRKRADEYDILESEESMELGGDDGSEMIEDGDDEFPYKHLDHALKCFWKSENLDLNVLQIALQHVNPVRAKLLEKQFVELTRDELKLRLKKNALSNDIINVACAELK